MECIGLDHILAVVMVIDMMVIVMEAGMKTEMVMVMAEKENMAIEMMIGIVVIVMAEIMKNAIAEMVTGMMSTGEEVQVLMTTNMAQEAGALIGTAVMMMMANIHLGMPQ